jgi:hypothetical protein
MGRNAEPARRFGALGVCAAERRKEPSAKKSLLHSSDDASRVDGVAPRSNVRAGPVEELNVKERRARRAALGLAVSAALVIGAGLAAGAGPHAQEGSKPYPIYTSDHLAGTMETLGPNFAAAARALEAGDYPAAKERLARAREQLATTITFWRQRGRDDGVGFVRAAVRAMDDLDAAMSVDDVDAPAASGFAADVQATCNACHAAYREPDPEGGFRLKTEALEP